MRADLQAKWSELLRQIAAAEAQYAALTPQQQAVVDNAAAPAATAAECARSGRPGDHRDARPTSRVAVPPPARRSLDIPEALPVGVASEAGLQPNTILAARAVSAQFPRSPTSAGSGRTRSRGIRAAWRSTS